MNCCSEMASAPRIGLDRGGLERFQTEIRIASNMRRPPRCVFFLALEHDTACQQHHSLIFDFVPAFKPMVERLGRDDLETVKLAGICRNLIRYWAEV
jgi:PKHD-type hydroxylase